MFCCKLILALFLVNGLATAIDQYKPSIYEKNDRIELKCLVYKEDGEAVKDIDGEEKYFELPNCLESRKSLAFNYGADEVVHCSFPESSGFYQQMLKLVSLNKPLKCRIAASKDPKPEYLPVFIPLQKTEGEKNEIRVSGNLNAVLHGQSGYIVSGSVYPVIHRPVPTMVVGLASFNINVLWFEGFTPSLPMSGSPEFKDSANITTTAAVLLCLLTATICYAIGRIYIENWLLPSVVLNEHTRPVRKPKSK